MDRNGNLSFSKILLTFIDHNSHGEYHGKQEMFAKQRQEFWKGLTSEMGKAKPATETMFEC